MLKKIIPLVTLLITLISCDQDTQTNDAESTSDNSQSIEIKGAPLPPEIQALVGTFSEKRPATNEDIEAFQSQKATVTKASCSLHGDASCSSQSTAEFMRYLRNCIHFTLPSSGGFNIITTRGAISYYVDGDGDVNCDHYEDDLQNMIDSIVTQLGGAVWSITPSVYQVSPCNERSRSNFIVFDLEIMTP